MGSGPAADKTSEPTVTHVLFSRFESDGAKRTLQKLIERLSPDRKHQKANGTGDDTNTAPIPFFNVQEEEKIKEAIKAQPLETCGIENTYDMPKGFLPITRTLVPKSFAKGKLTHAAVKALPGNASQDDIEDMEQFIREISNQIRLSIDSKLTMLIQDKMIQELKVLNVEGKVVSDFAGVVDAWKKKPSRALCAQLYELLYGMWDGDLMNFVVITTMLKLQLWFSNSAADKDKNYSRKDKLLDSFVKTIIHDKIRDVWRKKINRVKDTHGISISVTSDDIDPNTKKVSASRRRQKAGKFNFDFHVRGWNGEQHKAFLNNQKTGNASSAMSKKKNKSRSPEVSLRFLFNSSYLSSVRTYPHIISTNVLTEKSSKAHCFKFVIKKSK